jgi:hypothetical protein
VFGLRIIIKRYRSGRDDGLGVIVRLAHGVEICPGTVRVRVRVMV